MSLSTSVRALLVGVACGALSLSAPAALPEWIAFPESAQGVTLIRNGGAYLDVGVLSWGPQWAWMGLDGKVREEQGRTVFSLSGKESSSGAQLTLDGSVAASGRRLTFAMDLAASKDAGLTYFVLTVNAAACFDKGSVRVTLADGTTNTLAMPIGRQGLGKRVKRFEYVDDAGAATAFTLEPPLDVASDGAARIVLAEKQLAAGKPVHATLTVEAPGEVTYYASPASVPQDAGFADWFTFAATSDPAKPNELGLQDWLEAPAGKHGRIARKGEQLVYDGKPIKLWGLNNCYGTCAPERALAERRAAFYAKYGVNAVRLHKYADGPEWAGIQSARSFAEFDTNGLDRLDYFIAKLKERGIYTKLSSTFGVKLGPDDRAAVPYMDEFGKLGGGRAPRVATGHGSVYLSRELQDLQIRQIVNLLRHRNPHTGLVYAEDPAIAVIELFNEDSALFFGTMSQLQNIPTLRRRAGEQFTAWLEKRYGSKEKLLEAWGPTALDSFGYERLTGETWEAKTILPAGNPWYYDPDQLDGSQASRKRRLLDTMLFLYETQNEFYARYVAAIRAAGYTGEILASNWQAGRAFSHFYNLHSDSLVGLIDRHNYFGGGGGSRIDNATMLNLPGSGMLSAGLQQVSDRPFMLSEWIHVGPSEWGVEGPAIIGAYGMGLQGWDVSFMFQNGDTGAFSEKVGGQWDVTAPQVMGVFPAVARQVLRGDVRESDLVAPRYVNIPALAEGRLGFDDKAEQRHDVKTFDSAQVSSRALAVARCTVEFTDTFRETPRFDLAPYVKDGVYVSAGGELAWQPGATALDGFFTMNTPATKAVVGFAQGRTFELGEVGIAPRSRFGAVYVTAQGRDETIATARKLLVVAVARARNTGMKVLLDSRLLEGGKAPPVMEPVKAGIRLRREGTPTVVLLDHDGCRTDRTLEVKDGAFEIDGARDKTCYYLITYAP